MSDSICKLCDKAYSSFNYLMSHMKRIHNKEPKDFPDNTDGITIYIKPNQVMITDVKSDNVFDQNLPKNDQESNYHKSEEKQEAEPILGV